MSAWCDLKPRLDAGIDAREGLHVAPRCRSAALPGWLARPLTRCAAEAGKDMPVLVLNVKGRVCDDALCITTLAGLEQLVLAVETRWAEKAAVALGARTQSVGRPAGLRSVVDAGSVVANAGRAGRSNGSRRAARAAGERQRNEMQGEETMPCS